MFFFKSKKKKNPMELSQGTIFKFYLIVFQLNGAFTPIRYYPMSTDEL